MSRYELSISPNYVKGWSIYEAIREIFQNALDQESIDIKNVMGFSYINKTLYISSKSSSLTKSSLLFGNSSKSNNKSTIGQFGEGYKLALLVLVREGYDVTIYNYKSKEKWVPKFIKSKRFNSNLLVIDVSKYIFKSLPNDDLIFEIKGVKSLDFDLISSKCLFINKTHNIINTDFGEVLTDDFHKGKIYVNGLFVCECENKVINFGYNLKPEFLSLDRDRSIVDSFNLIWMTSKLWSKYKDKKFVADLIINKIPDVLYIDNHDSFCVSDDLFNSFSRVHGISSIPVSSYNEVKDSLKKYPKLKPVIVNKSILGMINNSSNYKSFLSQCEVNTYEQSPYDVLYSFMVKHDHSMNTETVKNLHNIIDKSKGWVNGTY